MAIKHGRCLDHYKASCINKSTNLQHNIKVNNEIIKNKHVKTHQKKSTK